MAILYNEQHMKLYDTQQKQYIEPELGKEVKIYVCGITPYDSAHLGHIFTFMTYDLMARRLEDRGHKVTMVRNVTDVDEPMYARATKLGISYMELADSEISILHDVLRDLNFLPLSAEPRASDYISQMADAVSSLANKGFTYDLEGDIYFDVAKYSDFKTFSGFNDALLESLFADRGGNPLRKGKRDKLDFLLWKHIDDPNDPAQWDSSFGKGRPGWHIECSVMSNALLGKTFDIHGGGTDLIFPHHECEIAQSVALNGVIPAKIWSHVSPMLMAGEKMSKSLGNMVFAMDLLQKYNGAVIRLALMHYHHRMGGEWQEELLRSSKKLHQNFVAACTVSTLENAKTLLEEVRAALDDDINTLEAIDALHRFIEKPKTRKSVTSSEESSAILNQVRYLIGLRQS